MNEQDVPVFWDGGYWYIVPCEFPRPNHRRPAVSPARWSATYGVIDGVDYALLRSPDIWLQAPAVPVTQEQVIAAAANDGYLPAGFNEKPGMRHGGL